MKITNISSYQKYPCYIVTVGNISILIDCPASCQGFLNFAPFSNNIKSSFNRQKIANYELEKKGLVPLNGKNYLDDRPCLLIPQFTYANTHSIDYVLISNYRNCLSLPYFFKIVPNFNGRIYATTPTVQFARQYMKELVESLNDIHPNAKSKWRMFWNDPAFPKLKKCNISELKELFTLESIEECLSRIEIINIDEIKVLEDTVNLIAISAGYVIGSCNWIIKSSLEKIAVVSKSSYLTTHIRKMSTEYLCDCDSMIFTSLKYSKFEPDNMLRILTEKAVEIINNDGSVIIPCYTSGIINDLIEFISKKFKQHRLDSIPIYAIGRYMKKSFAHTNIYAEWLIKKKCDKAFIPENPLDHVDLIESGQLEVYDSIYGEFGKNMRKPCLIFAGHPSLRFGNIVEIVELFADSPKNLLAIAEPDFAAAKALEPYNERAIQILNCPIDITLDDDKIIKTLINYKPKNVILTDKMHLQMKSKLNAYNDIKVWGVKFGKPIEIAPTNPFVLVNFSGSTLGNLTENDDGTYTINGSFSLQNNEIIFEKKDVNVYCKSCENGGIIKLRNFEKYLEQICIQNNVKINIQPHQNKAESYIIINNNMNLSIQDNKINLAFENMESINFDLVDCIMKNIEQFDCVVQN
ncbi:hypothetical protein A3Q56_04197 [Intoshia linei]|uniref:Beta-Casp domain-containing protein n=1 Tax=Intoshia linei TaxID=1819745 RepID=A0A177B2V7_9BILA|nr:hypothetical protein A3Q56_04197 [Intoshia linei]